jgi:filamentous hemagglutinin family protein
MPQTPLRSFPAFAFLIASVPSAMAQIATDGSLGPGRTLTGPTITIGADLGRQVGGNLFHSFSRFGLAAGESATFTGPASVANIVGRVTGGTPSSIDGTIRSGIAGANLFLMNPAGIAFGPNSRLDVSGSFHASTANYLRFVDGARFQATNLGDSSFTTAPPAAFGFLGGGLPGTITAEGGVLATPPGRDFSLVAGDVRISGARVAAPAGRLQVVGAAPGTEVLVDAAANASLPPGSGPVTIERQALVEASDFFAGQGGGSVYIRGGALRIDRGIVGVLSFGEAPGGVLSLQGRESIRLTNGATVLSRTFGPTQGVSVSVVAPSVAVRDFSAIISDSRDTGAAGPMEIRPGSLDISASGRIGSAAFSTGAAGDVVVEADTISIDSGGGSDLITGIFSQAEAGSTGRAGKLRVEAKRILSTGSGSGISSATFGPGRAGNIDVTATDELTLLGGGAIRSSTIETATPDEPPVATGGAGDIVARAGDILVDGSRSGIRSEASRGSAGAGTVQVTGDRTLTVRAGGAISSSTFGTGAAGAVVAQAPRVTLDGSGTTELATGTPGVVTGLTGIFSQAEPDSLGAAAGNVTVRASGQLVVTENAKISSSTFSSGNAGSVLVEQTGDVFVSSLGEIRSSSFGGGNAGSVTVRARSVTGDDAGRGAGSNVGRTGINSRTESDSSGDAGSVEVVADRITLQRGSAISSSALGTGGGGDVTVRAGEAVVLERGDSRVSALSQGRKGAGTITIDAPSLTVRDGAAVTTQSSTSDGGNIRIHARDLVYLRDGRITTSVAAGVGNGGNISIDPDFVVLSNGIIQANAFGGNGGNIRIVAGQFLSSPSSVVEASSQLGISGTINIQAPDSNVTGSLAELSGKFFDASTVRREGCAGPARAERQPSSLVASGRGGVPFDGSEQRPAGYFAGRELTKGKAEAVAPTPSRGEGKPVLRISCR